MRLLLPFILIPLAAFAAPPAQNHSALAAAFEATSDSGAVIIYAHGSDWNPAGEIVAERIWKNPAFTSALAAGTTRASIDILETPRTRRVDRAILRGKSQTPASTKLTVHGSLTYSSLGAGSWQLDSLKSAPQETTYAIDITPASTVSPDDALLLTLSPPITRAAADRHPGLANNGRITVSEITIKDAAGKNIPIRAIVTSEESNRGLPITRLTDADESRNGAWAADHNNFRPVKFLIFPASPLAASANISLNWSVKNTSNNQLPTEIQLKQITPADSAKLIAHAYDEETLAQLDLNTKNLPAIFLYKKNRTSLGSIAPIHISDDPSATAHKINQLLKTTRAAEAIIASADQVSDSQEKIRLIVQGAEKFGSHLHGEYRKQLVKQITDLDKSNTSPWRWRFDFNTSEFSNQLAELNKNQGLEAAFSFIDQTLSSPRASKLTHEQKQQLLLEKFNLARAAKKDWPELVPILKAVIAIDPTTHLGIGAAGQIDSNGLGEPSIAFGFWPSHLKAGNNTLTISKGLAVFISTDGSYQLELIKRKGSKGTLTITSASLIDSSGKELSSYQKPQTINDATNSVKIPLTVPPGIPAKDLRLQLNITAENTPAASCTLTFAPCLALE